MNVTVSLADAGFVRRMKAAPGRVQASLKRVVATSALRVQKGARQRVPVQTGRLRSSLRSRFNAGGLGAEIYTDVRYAAFVEFGTGAAGSASDHPDLPDGYTHGDGPGRAARPFMHPAAEEERPRFLKAAAQAMEDV